MTKEDFKECFENHFDRIRNYIYYRCGDTELATDVAQETFLKIWEKNMDYDPIKTKSLLYKIAKEHWISLYRKQESAAKYRFSLSWPENSNEIEEQINYQELKKKYESALESMSVGQREVFLMSRMDQMTYKDIAESLSISVKAIEKRMHLALTTLKKNLQNEK